MEARKGDWCGTYTGVHFWSIDARPEDIRTEDIAHALSQICRFNGHSKYFYSVAQHSINVAKAIKDAGYSNIVQFYGLIHDASEAYLCDIPRPLKNYLPGYKETEKNLMDIIYQAFVVPCPSIEESAIVKKYDDIILTVESKALMKGYQEWELVKTDYICNIERKDNLRVEQEFLSYFDYLMANLDN